MHTVGDTMKITIITLLLVLSTFAAPVRVQFDEPVARGDVLHQSATINYFYVDTEYLDLYTSIGSVRMCYPAPPANADTAIAAWEEARYNAICQIILTPDEMQQDAHIFIKQTVPARFKAWAEGE